MNVQILWGLLVKIQHSINRYGEAPGGAPLLWCRVSRGLGKGDGSANRCPRLVSPLVVRRRVVEHAILWLVAGVVPPPFRVRLVAESANGVSHGRTEDKQQDELLHDSTSLASFVEATVWIQKLPGCAFECCPHRHVPDEIRVRSS
jgi:hypothetical protein